MGGRVLILDDNDLALRQWRRVGDRDGFETVTARTAEEAIDVLSRGGVTAIISDFSLDVGTSLPALRIASERSPHVPAVLLTSNPDGARAAIRAAGVAYPVFQKRLSMSTVLHALVQRREEEDPGTPDAVVSVDVGGRTYIAELDASSGATEIREEPGGRELRGVYEGRRFVLEWESLRRLAADTDPELVRLAIDLALNDR